MDFVIAKKKILAVLLPLIIFNLVMVANLLYKKEAYLAENNSGTCIYNSDGTLDEVNPYPNKFLYTEEVGCKGCDTEYKGDVLFEYYGEGADCVKTNDSQREACREDYPYGQAGTIHVGGNFILNNARAMYLNKNDEAGLHWLMSTTSEPYGNALALGNLREDIVYYFNPYTNNRNNLGTTFDSKYDLMNSGLSVACAVEGSYDTCTGQELLNLFRVSVSNKYEAEISEESYAELLSEARDFFGGNGEEDDDGLSLAFEMAFGTNPFSSDTDNDGYSDKEEIANGYNPNGLGVLPIGDDEWFNNWVEENAGKIITISGSQEYLMYIDPTDARNNLKFYFIGPRNKTSLDRAIEIVWPNDSYANEERFIKVEIQPNDHKIGFGGNLIVNGDLRAKEALLGNTRTQSQSVKGYVADYPVETNMYEQMATISFDFGKNNLKVLDGSGKTLRYSGLAYLRRPPFAGFKVLSDSMRVNGMTKSNGSILMGEGDEFQKGPALYKDIDIYNIRLHPHLTCDGDPAICEQDELEPTLVDEEFVAIPGINACIDTPDPDYCNGHQECACEDSQDYIPCKKGHDDNEGYCSPTP